MLIEYFMTCLNLNYAEIKTLSEKRYFEMAFN